MLPLDEAEMARLELYDGGMRVYLASGGSFPARSVVYADEVSFPNIPAFVGRMHKCLVPNGPGEVPPSPFTNLKTAESLDVADLGVSQDETVLIVGGGMTSAYLAINACESGCNRVILMCRHNLKKREFEVLFRRTAARLS